ncbi:MAG: DMT family transporter [Bacteroidales bacterium]|nr:DMT family transporter [Bacteroidales bacterium]
MVKQNPRAHLSMLAATLLFGVNYWIAKGLMPNHLLPMQIIFLRVLGTLIIAWIIQISVKELRVLKIDRADYPRLILSSLLGVAINQMMFFTGLNHTTPVDAAIINSVSPILVLVFAAWILKEHIGISRLAGILLGATGALMLILLGNQLSLKGGSLTGDMFIVANTAAWSLYLVISKPLMVKYNPFLMMRWMFLIGFIGVFPFTIRQALEINFSSFDSYTWFSIFYIIIGTTFMAYFFITYSLKRLSSSVVAYYTYIQPVIVAIIGILVFAERISWVKIVSGLLVFAGIYFVTRKKRTEKSKF